MLIESYKRITKGYLKYKNFFTANKVKSNDFIIIFPGKNREINYQGLLYLDSFYTYREYLRGLTLTEEIVSPPAGKFFVISCEQDVAESAKLFSNRVVVSEVWNEYEIECLISFYGVKKLDTVIFVSFERPNGRTCSNLRGINGIELRSMICMGIYSISRRFFESLKTPDKPCYSGDNRIIKDFINAG